MQRKFVRIIKIFVSVALVWVIWRYFLKIENPEQIWNTIKTINPLIFVFAISVSLLNWGLEAKKWQLLLVQLEPISFRNAWKSTCSGAAVSNILPFRIGEYLGRVLFITHENRIPAIFNSVFGSTVQLSVSMLFGIPASFYLLDQQYNKLSIYAFIALISIIVFFSFIFTFSKRIKNARKVWISKVLEDIQKFTIRQILVTFLISILRYILFASFYVLLLYYLHVSDQLLYLYGGVATIYLVQSFAPSMILTDAGLRTGIPLMVFKTTLALQPPLLAAAILNYFFNVLFPAILGLIYIVMQKIKG